MSEIDQCRACGKPYYVDEIGGQMPGTKESEDIRCPYCRNTYTRRSNGVFRTSKLSEEAEKQWRIDQEQRT